MSDKTDQDKLEPTQESTKDEWCMLGRSPKWLLELSDDEVEKLNRCIESEEMSSFNQQLVEEISE